MIKIIIQKYTTYFCMKSILTTILIFHIFFLMVPQSLLLQHKSCRRLKCSQPNSDIISPLPCALYPIPIICPIPQLLTAAFM